MGRVDPRDRSGPSRVKIFVNYRRSGHIGSKGLLNKTCFTSLSVCIVLVHVVITRLHSLCAIVRPSVVCL